MAYMLILQELMSIRERLEFITPLLEPRLQPPARRDDTSPQNCPPLILKSPHLMQVFGLPSDLASSLYRLETAVPRMLASATESPCVFNNEDQQTKDHSAYLTISIFRRFQDQVHQWYPILHSDFTLHFCESNAAGFPYSTISCLSLLVEAIASIVNDRPHSSHYEAALSMIPIAIQECSITTPSETSMHLNLPRFGETLRGGLTTTPLPTSTYVWDHFGDSNTPSRSSLSGIFQNSEAYSPNETLQSPFNFCTEVNLQQVLNGYASSATDVLSAYDDGSPHTEWKANSSRSLDSLPDTFSQDNGFESHNINSPICRAKYHMYEVSIYWPVIYRIILDGIADTELLPYGPLFFESVTSFLSAAKIALQACLPKSWFLCASIYTISFAAIRALEVRCLRLLAEPRLWQYLEASVDALHGPSELSPSIQDMRETLKDRLEMAKDQKSG
ncbi:uncharacterized protein N7484_009824 [Penicillium longicatenatum]|uniref:uncharacterized protein n=1 Tax=Penicillium longicatenatum TaxID=1561947 RepID=UPI002548B8E0|nr:uncharacterized protein N7484_009824 [Penicillium longicatenatum]KAJ5636511.1 hypothetical protein N7484_009824 [Penicillium longicatenatum]